MAVKKIGGTLSYKIGFIFSWFMTSFIRMLFNGIKATIKNIYFGIFYFCLVVATVISYFVYHNISVMLLIIFIVIFVVGVGNYIKEYPIIKKRKYFYKLFEELKMQGADDSLPYFLCQEEISDYASSLSFASLIPISVWNTNKELLEIHMDAKIIDIKQDEDTNRIVDLIIQTKQLPKVIDWNHDYIDRKNNILNIGMSHEDIVGMNLETNPHGFIAGETGSGKSNILKCLIFQALAKDYDVILIDFKRGVSFSIFSDFVEIYYDYPSVIKILKEMVIETIKRLDKFREKRVDNINDYNKIGGGYLRRKIIFIDELAELLKTRDKEISNILNISIETLTRLSRAVGIHLIMGVQRPDSTVISGQIKNNVPYRVCGRFVDREPSRIMLSSDIASTLPNIKGRFIVKDSHFREVQCFYFDERKLQSKNKKQIHEKAETSLDNNIIVHEPPKEKPLLQPANEFEFDFSDLRKQ